MLLKFPRNSAIGTIDFDNNNPMDTPSNTKTTTTGYRWKLRTSYGSFASPFNMATRTDNNGGQADAITIFSGRQRPSDDSGLRRQIKLHQRHIGQARRYGSAHWEYQSENKLCLWKNKTLEVKFAVACDRVTRTGYKLLDLEAWSRRNNLVFYKISDLIEVTRDECENNLVDFLSREMKMGEGAKNIVFHCLHRCGKPMVFPAHRDPALPDLVITKTVRWN